jgi:hypothetical protein
MMRNHFTHIATAVLCAATAVACGSPGKNVSDSGRYATEGGRGSGSPEQFVKLDGCVAPGTSPTGEYLLRDVVVPAPATQPQGGQETMQHPPIANGTWVRLAGDNDELHDHLGKRVEIMGRMRDTGANTMGTSGHSGTNEEKFERSSNDAGTNPVRNIPPTTAAPAGADANGTTALIAVERVRELSGSCGEEK